MAAPSYTYSLANGATADASQVMQNFNDVLNGISDGTKDLTISALTTNGAVNLKAAVILGTSTSNDLTVNGQLASTINIKTNNSVNIGSATLGLAGVYLGNGGVGATCRLVSASHATTRTYTFPDAGAAANVVLSEANATINGIKTFAGGAVITGITGGGAQTTGQIGEYLEGTCANNFNIGGNNTYSDVTGATVTLTAGVWFVGYHVVAAITRGSGSAAAFFNLRSGTATETANTFAFMGWDTTINNLTLTLSACTMVNITGTTTYKLSGQTSDGTNNVINVRGNSDTTGACTAAWALRIR